MPGELCRVQQSDCLLRSSCNQGLLLALVPLHTILSLRFCRQFYRTPARMRVSLKDLGARRSTLAAASGEGLRASTVVKQFPLLRE